MRRPFRFLFTLAAALSLVLSVAAAAALWVRSYRTGGNRFGFKWPGEHRTLRSEAGWLRLMKPAPSTTPADDPAVRERVARMRNDDLVWHHLRLYFRGDLGGLKVAHVTVDPAEDSPASSALVLALAHAGGGKPPGAADVTPALLEALDDPGRFAAAHVLLRYAERVSPPGPLVVWTTAAARDGVTVADCGGGCGWSCGVTARSWAATRTTIPLT